MKVAVPPEQSKLRLSLQSSGHFTSAATTSGALPPLSPKDLSPTKSPQPDSARRGSSSRRLSGSRADPFGSPLGDVGRASQEKGSRADPFGSPLENVRPWEQDSLLKDCGPNDSTSGQMDRLLDRVKKVRADRLARQDGLPNGRYRVDDPNLKVLDTVKDWLTVQHVKTGEIWFYNAEDGRVAFERPYHLRNAQDISDRETALHILEGIEPENRTNAQLESLSRLLKDCAVLQQFGSETLREACRMMRHQKNDPKESIMWQGDDADNFYYLIRGSVGVWITTDAPKFEKKICETGGPVGAIKVVVLGEGKGFGEQGLMYDEKRNASIVTEGACEFAVIEKRYFCDVLKDHFIKAAKKRSEFLQIHLPVILGADRIRSFDAIEGFFKEATVEKGSVLCETGRKNDTLEVIYEGTCKTFWRSKNDNSGTQSEKFPLCELGKGQFLGISSVIMDAPEKYDVIATTSVKVLRMQKADVHSRLPQLMRELFAESEQIRVSRYADLAKRAQVCSHVEDLSRDLLDAAKVRRQSREGKDLIALSSTESRSKTTKSPDSDNESGFGSDDESANASRRGSNVNPLDGLQYQLRNLRRHSCTPPKDGPPLVVPMVRRNSCSASKDVKNTSLLGGVSLSPKKSTLLQPMPPSGPKPVTSELSSRPRRGSSHL